MYRNVGKIQNIYNSKIGWNLIYENYLFFYLLFIIY